MKTESKLTEISLPAGRTALWLAGLASVLLVVHVCAMQLYFNNDLGFAEEWRLKYWHVAMFDLDEEEGFGTWLSAVNLLLAGRILLTQWRARCTAGDGRAPFWLVLAVGFHILSVDEVAGMHEFLNSVLGDDNPWTNVAMVGLGVVAVAFLPFLVGLPRRTAVLFVIAGLLFAGGAVGVEHWTDSDVNSLHYNMWTTLEEGMEMFGVILFIYALLDHMRVNAEDTLRLDLIRARS